MNPYSPNDPTPYLPEGFTIDAVVTSDDYQSDQAQINRDGHDDPEFEFTEEDLLPWDADTDEERDFKLGSTVTRLVLDRIMGWEDLR